jgi:hypothetical protein
MYARISFRKRPALATAHLRDVVGGAQIIEPFPIHFLDVVQKNHFLSHFLRARGSIIA